MAQWLGLLLCHYLVIVAALIYPGGCFASQFKNVMSAIAYPNKALSQANLSGHTLPEYKESEQELIKGIELIESMKTATTCKTKVTEQLLNSCSALDGSAPQETRSRQELDKVKQQYAARLAVCELKEAEDPPKLPRCSLLGSKFGPFVNRDQLAACLRELQDSPAFWSSYVNNLQNVGYMCQVARAEIEKEELVEQRRASLQTTLLVTKALSEFQQSVNTQNAELLKNAQVLRDLHHQNVKDLATARKQNAATINQMKENFDAYLQKMTDQHLAAAEIIMANATRKSQELSQYAQIVQYSLERAWQRTAEGVAEHAAQRLQDSTASHEMVLATQRTLDSIVSEHLSTLSGGLSSLSSGLQYAENQVTSLHRGHASLADSLETSLTQAALLAGQLEDLKPLLETLATVMKTMTQMVRLFLSEETLRLICWLSISAVLITCSTYSPFRAIRWLLWLTVLLTIPYGMLSTYAYLHRDLSFILRLFLEDLLEVTWKVVVIMFVIYIIFIFFRALRRFDRAIRQFDRAYHQLPTFPDPEPPAINHPSPPTHIHPKLPMLNPDDVLPSIERDRDKCVTPPKSARQKTIQGAMRRGNGTGRIGSAPPYPYLDPSAISREVSINSLK